jgi:hypothetical protein
MIKPQTATDDSIKSRDDIVVYTSAADIADFIANGSPASSAPWNTYPHFAKNNTDDDMDIEENVGITVEGETEVISVVVTGDGASHQFGILNYNLFDYQDAESGTITFKYFFPTGHGAIGKYWHVGTATKDYTAKPHQIVGNAWTETTLQFGTKHGGGRDKEGRSARFLCIKDSNGVPTEQSGTTYTGTGTLHLKDIVVVGEVPSIETNSQTTYDGV